MGEVWQESENQLEAQPDSTKSKKRLKLLFILGVLLAIATSFMVYLGSQNNKVPVAAVNSGAPAEKEEKSIGVLPFANLSGDPEFEYFSDGMTDAIINKLSKINSFQKVVPFTTMSSFKNSNKGIVEIARELGVTHLLEGNVQKAGDTVKVVLRLIDGNADTYDWSDEYFAAWNLDELFQMQTLVAENVAGKLGIEITSDELNEIGKKETENFEAYMCLQRAGYNKNFYDEEGFDVAEQLYHQAIQLDSNFTEAYIGLGYIWMLRSWQGLYEEQGAISKCLFNLQIALDQGTEDPWAVDTFYTFKFWYDWDFETLEALFQEHSKQGTLLDMPRSADYSVKTGRADVANQIMDKLIESDSNDAKWQGEKLRYLLILGKLNEFEKLVQELNRYFLEDRDYNSYVAKLYITLGDYGKAKIHADKFKITQSKYFHGGKIYYNWLQAVLAAKNGNNIVSEKYLMEIKNFYNEGISLGNPCWYIALYYCAIGDRENTIRWLQNSYKNHEVEMTWLYAEPLLEPVKDDPRYIELLHKVGFSKVIDL